MNRRELLKGGLALPFIPAALSGCSGSAADNLYLQENFAPVTVESTITDLQVTGTIPPELIGRFLRNGPNPGEDAGGDYHWFTGRGMVDAFFWCYLQV